MRYGSGGKHQFQLFSGSRVRQLRRESPELGEPGRQYRLRISYRRDEGSLRVSPRSLSERGVIDRNFALRANNNLRDLVVEGRCGAFFGLWWTPNNPLMDSRAQDGDALWEPYYLQEPCEEDAYDSFRDNKYVVVRKGYE